MLMFILNIYFLNVDVHVECFMLNVDVECFMLNVEVHVECFMLKDHSINRC